MSQPQPSPVEVAKQIGAQFSLARQLHGKGELQKAGQICQQILQHVADHQGALHLLVMINRDLGQVGVATQLLQRLEGLAGSGNTDVMYEWGVLHYMQGEPLKAEARLKSLLRQMPNHANAHMVLGRIYDRMGRLGAADIHLRHALEFRPSDETICKDIASINERLGLIDTGVRFAKLAYNLKPKYLDAILIWAKLEERRDNLAEAERLVNYAATLRPDEQLVKVMRGYLMRRRREYKQGYEILDSIDMQRLNPEAQAIAWQERGFCLERLEKYDEAFEAFSAMSVVNRKPPINRNYPEEAMAKEFSQLHEYWEGVDPETLSKIAAQDDEWPTPLFILGFPRSGTTMVEQIVSSLPDVLAGDETHALYRSFQHNPGGPVPSLRQPSERLSDESEVARMRDQYMYLIRQQAVLEPGYQYFTDKTPLNEVHMGVIQAILPEAPMVHLIRHPLNVVLSSFFNDVRHGHYFATKLETTAQHYAHTMDMVELYREKLDMRYLQVRYEDIVDDLESNARKIVDFIGLPWDERCLDFHLNKRHVRTASSLQVKEKLYTSSLERYKPFLKHLEPVIPILEPYIEKYGYTIEG